MSDKTGIAWTERTWNPWQGCAKVSAACTNCYMFREKRRYGQKPDVVVRSAKQTFNRPLSKSWSEPALAFTCSWSDFFIAEADGWRAEAWDIIRRTPHLTYQILTKRPERILDCLPPDWGAGWPHVWLGVTAENQEKADLRIPMLLKVPAALRFLSCEPLLGPVNLLQNLPAARMLRWYEPMLRKLDWVIVGGESGPGARRMDVRWPRSLVAQCAEAKVPVFVKQMGAEMMSDDDRLWSFKDRSGADPAEWPVDLRVRQMPERP